MAKSIDSIKYSNISRNHYIIEKPIDDDYSIILTKHEIVKSVSTLDNKIYNSFLAFYYSLMIGDSNGFYSSITALSNAMSNHSKSFVNNSPNIHVDKVSIKPFRL